jgi:hypothetical protein
VKPCKELLHFAKLGFVPTSDSQLHLSDHTYCKGRCIFQYIQTINRLAKLQGGIN